MVHRILPFGLFVTCFLLFFGVKSRAAAPDALKTAARIDQLLAEEIHSEGTKTTQPTDDETYLRRVSLDLVGDLPSPEEITAFALDPSGEKRDWAVERLLADEQYGQNWARYWRDVILSRRTEDRSLIVANPLVVYLTEKLNRGTPWNEIATEFITSTGNIRELGHTAIIAAQEGQTEGTTSEFSRIFLGIQIQCAQCHDHVTDRWKRDQFHQMAAFFPRIALRPLRNATMRTLEVVGDDNGSQGRKTDGRRAAREHFMPDLNDPSASGTKMQPVFFLSGKEIELGTTDADRRSQAAEWITSDPWFAKALVNRVWSEMVGEGFYEPVDDMGPDRECMAPETMDYLSEQFAASDYDLKWLYRTVAATKAYQSESRPRRNLDETPFTANCPQRLRADQLYNALTSAFGIDEVGQAARGRRGGGQYGQNSPRTRFGVAFSYDPSIRRDEVSGSIPQALALMNSRQIGALINGNSPQTMLGKLLRNIDDNQAVVVELYLRCLAREPRESEWKTCEEHLASVDDRAEAFEDVLWALINSTEFLHRR